MLWILIYVTLAVATLIVMGGLGWRVFGALQALGHEIEAAERRINPVIQPLQSELAALSDRPGGGPAPGRPAVAPDHHPSATDRHS
ncbi:MAG: hypothetical protein L0Y54_08545 [Sporichthyaceae bacterium]|nr:hypothetical protein [Sporichthyaceae bacterium]